MKNKLTHKTLTVAMFALLLGACDSKEESADANAAEPAAEDAAPAEEPASKDEAPVAEAEEVVDHDTLVGKGADYEGKEVTVEAVSWGTANMAGGGKRLNLGKEKLTGMQQAHLVADFPKEDTSVDAVEKDATVKMKCKVGKKAYGARELEDCKIL